MDYLIDKYTEFEDYDLVLCQDDYLVLYAGISYIFIPIEGVLIQFKIICKSAPSDRSSISLIAHNIKINELQIYEELPGSESLSENGKGIISFFIPYFQIKRVGIRRESEYNITFILKHSVELVEITYDEFDDSHYTYHDVIGDDSIGISINSKLPKKKTTNQLQKQNINVIWNNDKVWATFWGCEIIKSPCDGVQLSYLLWNHTDENILLSISDIKINDVFISSTIYTENYLHSRNIGIVTFFIPAIFLDYFRKESTNSLLVSYKICNSRMSPYAGSISWREDVYEDLKDPILFTMKLILPYKRGIKCKDLYNENQVSITYIGGILNIVSLDLYFILNNKLDTTVKIQLCDCTINGVPVDIYIDNDDLFLGPKCTQLVKYYVSLYGIILSQEEPINIIDYIDFSLSYAIEESCSNWVNFKCSKKLKLSKKSLNIYST